MKYLFSFASSVLIAALIISLSPVHGEAMIYDDVLRLHVIAESDSDEDQALKLKVRDAVLNVVGDAVAGCGSIDEAVLAVDGIRGEIEAAARRCIAENGADYGVSVELGRERYPRREYDGATLPAGVYNSLRVTIGAGEGRNWWCVLFPSVCMRFSSVSEEECAAVGLTPSEYRIITEKSGKVRIRLRLLEVIAGMVGIEY